MTFAPIVFAATFIVLFVEYESRPSKPGAAHDEINTAGFCGPFALRNTGAGCPHGQ